MSEYENFEDDINFWDDINDDNDIINSRIKTQPNSFIKKNINKKTNIQSLQKLYNKYDYLIKEYTNNKKNKTLETQISKKNKKKNNCEILYEAAKLRDKKLELQRKEYEELKLSNELKECSFQPNVNLSNKNKTKNNLNNFSIYDRNINWLINKKENLVKCKKKNADSLRNSFNYKPNINNIDDKYIESLFNEENNIENYPENFSYLFRQYNVRNNKNNNKKNHSFDNSFFIQTSHYTGKDLGKKITKKDFSSFKTRIHNEIQKIK